MDYNDYLLGKKEEKNINNIEITPDTESLGENFKTEEKIIVNDSLSGAKNSEVIDSSLLDMEKSPKELTISSEGNETKSPDDLSLKIIGDMVLSQTLGTAYLAAKGFLLNRATREIRNSIFGNTLNGDETIKKSPRKITQEDDVFESKPKISELSTEDLSKTPKETALETLEISIEPKTIEETTLDIKKESKEVEETTLDVSKESKEVEETASDVSKESKEVEEVYLDIEKSYKEINLSNLKYAHKNREISADELEQLRPSLSSIGYISVIPQDEVDGFKIPFEFLPEIKEGSYSAQYNATSVLARIGNLQNYSHTEVSTPSITSTYYVFAKDENSTTESYGNAWMNYYTLEKVQAIQRMYESLVFPKFPRNEEEGVEKEFSYLRPPFVKIIIGSEDDSTLFTYPKLQNGDLNSQDDKRRHKLYVVTNVSVEKNLQETPLILKEEGKIVDTFGFSVTIDLLEVTKSYMDIYPDYGTYFKSFQTVSSSIDGWFA